MIQIDNFFLMSFIGLAIITLVLLLTRISTKKVIFFSVIYLYATIVFGLTLCPIPFQGMDFIVEADNNLVPFATIIDTVQNVNTQSMLLQIGGNIAMFIPCGVLLHITVKRNRRIFVPIAIMLLPLFVEIVQHAVGLAIGYNYRSFDIDDIILGSIGGLIGYSFCMMVLSKLIVAKRKKEQK